MKIVRMTRSLLLLLVGLSLLTVGCKKKNGAPTALPAEIRYNVSFYPADDKSGVDNRVPTLAGTSLEINGRPMATLQRISASSQVYATWKGPKAEVNALVAGPFVLRGKGACGAFDIPLEGPPASWKGLKDDALAPYLTSDGELSFSNWLKVPPTVDILVDRGASTAKVQIGEAPIAEGNEAAISLAGCKSAVPVSIDGKKVGEIEATSSKAYLVTLEPNVCHSYQLVGYGKYESSPLSHLPAKPLTPLESKPVAFLERAPDSQRVGGGGTVSSELLREPCPAK
jgi:hypothetical protein